MWHSPQQGPAKVKIRLTGAFRRAGRPGVQQEPKSLYESKSGPSSDPASRTVSDTATAADTSGAVRLVAAKGAFLSCLQRWGVRMSFLSATASPLSVRSTL